MDIVSLSDLLNEFVSKEVEFLNKQKIKHPPTIGTMYEGLTKEIFKKSIFKGLSLRVITNSFIENCNTEFDVLLVEGEGKQIPYSDRHTYKPEQVIAVVQARKNLYAKDIKESYDNLKHIIDYYQPREPERYVGRLFRDAFRVISRKDVTVKDKGELSSQEEMIFSTLLIEAFLPIRIVWGYNGFASEYNFRKSFVEYLKEKLSSKEWEPAILNNTQFVIINELCKNGEIDLTTDEDLESFVTKGGYNTVDDFVSSLLDTGLVFKESNKLKLLTDLCQCVILPDGRYVAGENKRGRLTAWVNKLPKEQK